MTDATVSGLRVTAATAAQATWLVGAVTLVVAKQLQAACIVLSANVSATLLVTFTLCWHRVGSHHLSGAGMLVIGQSYTRMRAQDYTDGTPAGGKAALSEQAAGQTAQHIMMLAMQCRGSRRQSNEVLDPQDHR